MTGSEIRSSFLEFFRQRGHEIVPSASLVPHDDPTLMFTNAGMVPFKNVFLGKETRAIPRVADSQRCLRLSGKHNDLEEVGRDTYHHTMFEMLGNWSFGDYYKREAISWAWELLTDVWKLPKDKLYATVYRTDDEAAALWAELTDIDQTHILRFGEKDNFWEMGDVGPCGPCSEIHIDRGPANCDKQHETGHLCEVNGGCARFVELWNLVFIQNNRLPDGSLDELPAKHVDTGAGLERIAAVLQGKRSNYDTDLFLDLIRFTEARTKRPYGEDEETDVSYRVLADHSRAIAFLITDGVLPGNDGRNYVLRRLLRRAARHAKHLGLDEPFLFELTGAVVDSMGAAYPELVAARERIADAVRQEEEQFVKTLDKGLSLLAQEKEVLRQSGSHTLPGDIAFRLYDTYGFPLDMTQDILRTDGIAVDEAGYAEALDAQRRRGREARKSGAEVATNVGAFRSRFAGDRIYDWESEISALLIGRDECAEARAGEDVQIIVPETPFYGESGGQVGDRGRIETESGAVVEIVDAIKPNAELTVHLGKVVQGAVHRGERVRLIPDQARRDASRLNHSATHILNAVLRRHLGDQVEQRGSLVAPERLRFDFSYNGAIDAATLERIETDVNAHIRENALVTTEEMAFADAMAAGALAFFEDKYGDRVRVVRMGSFSTELCGGTHVAMTGDIGVLRLRSESGVSSGVRRIEATTGAGALEWMRGRDALLRQLGELVKGDEDKLAERIEKLVQRQKELERQLQQAAEKLAGAQSGDLLEDERYAFTTKAGFKAVVAPVAGADNKRLLDLADKLRDRIGSGAVVLAGDADGRVSLLAAVTKDLAGGKVHAGKLIGEIAPIVGGRGGGKPDLAQAGGKDPAGIAEALLAARRLLGAE
jgi:alanyl-tRNA synthetase